MQYGPFTPQECETVMVWLKKHNIRFDIIKDQSTEDEFRSSSGANIVKQAEFRTETFLAQLFYLEIPQLDEKLSAELNSMFGVSGESFPKSLTEKPETTDLHEAILQSSRTKRFWATLLIVIWVLFFIGYFFGGR